MTSLQAEVAAAAGVLTCGPAGCNQYGFSRATSVPRSQAEVAASAGGLTPAQLAEVFLPVVADVTKEAEVVALPRIVAKRWPGSGVVSEG